MSDRDHEQLADDSAVLRPELARVREEAGNALAQMRRELDASRLSQDSMRDVDSVTDQIAMQQELDTIRNSLNEKERLVDATAALCRRLEDDLEDQHLAHDGLKQDLDSKKLSLAAAREQVARMTQERMEIEARYQALLSSGQVGLPRSRPGRREQDSRIRIVGGLFAGLLLAVGALAWWLWLGPFSQQDSGTTDELDAPAPVSEKPAAGSGEEVVAPDRHQAPVGGGQSLPAVLGIVNDPLRDGSAGPPMLALQGGAFTMGKQRTLPTDDFGPSRGVHLDGYLIGVTEVTFEEYDRFARATGRRYPQDFGWGRGRRPVVDVSWADARAYADWLSRQTGRHYRLPSEAEWEYAAAAGSRSKFWWGYPAGQGRAVCFDCGTMWDKRSSAPAGSFDPNPLGIYDTAGNVMEWVEDCYHPSYDRAPLDGRPWDAEDCRFRVARGGAFNKPARSMRTTARHRFDPDTRINSLGFRLARDE